MTAWKFHECVTICLYLWSSGSVRRCTSLKYSTQKYYDRSDWDWGFDLRSKRMSTKIQQLVSRSGKIHWFTRTTCCTIFLFLPCRTAPSCATTFPGNQRRPTLTPTDVAYNYDTGYQHLILQSHPYLLTLEPRIKHAPIPVLKEAHKILPLYFPPSACNNAPPIGPPTNAAKLMTLKAIPSLVPAFDKSVPKLLTAVGNRDCHPAAKTP